MKKHDIVPIIIVLVFTALVIWAVVSIKSCIARSDMNPWMKAWLLFGGRGCRDMLT